MNSKGQNFLFNFVLILLMTVVAGGGAWTYLNFSKKEKARKKLEEIVVEQRRINRKLQQLIEKVDGLRNDPDAVSKVGREKFNLCEEGETVIKEVP